MIMIMNMKKQKCGAGLWYNNDVKDKKFMGGSIEYQML